MAWTGDVTRRIMAVRPETADSCTLIFEMCTHEQRLNYPADLVIGRLRETICAQCSKPNWDQLGKIRDGIKFEDVLGKLKARR
jgi:hypothetical protein